MGNSPWKWRQQLQRQQGLETRSCVLQPGIIYIYIFFFLFSKFFLKDSSVYSTHDGNGRSPPHDEGLETRCVSQPGIFLLLIFFSDLLTLFTSILVSTVPTTATDGHHHMTTNG